MTHRDLIAGACIFFVVVALLLAWNKHYMLAWACIVIDVAMLIPVIRRKPPQ